MTSKEIRARFLAFFHQKQHEIAPSAPMVVQSDPTLMFTNAGMNQFKDFFLGHAEPSFQRIANTQKCLRVSGKHNDLEEVGMDTYHHTMFEMLGNWSFGDYFKKEAIQWAWELLTVEFGLPQARMYVSVFGGDAAEGLALDQEAYDLWKGIVPEGSIVLGDKKDNFWEMGDTGPCGPCSEIHIDLRPEEEAKATPGKSLVNQDHPQVVELWNLVFMQYNRLANGSLTSLPARHVDTGMGFERLVMTIQKKQSNYDTDLFVPLISQVAQAAGVTYGKEEKMDIALRVIADHVRAIAFAIADGQLPSNNKAGYVIRRILRRAVRYGYTFLNFKAPFVHRLVPLLAEQFQEVFPELAKQRGFIEEVIQQEEVSFLRTLAKGLAKIELIAHQAQTGSKRMDGKTAFELYDTYGFPLDLTSLIAREKGLDMDLAGFEQEMQKQKKRSKKAAEASSSDWIEVHPTDKVTFVGYDHLSAKAQIAKYRRVEEKGKTKYQIVLNQTPCYAESGGQVGDTGYLAAGEEKIAIVDTKKENDLIIHLADRLPARPEATFEAVVHAHKRKMTADNHSATHLLHAALRQVLGQHVQQKGSLVNDKTLRFDFSHFAKMTDEEISQVEQMVNEKIRQNIPLEEERNLPIAEAKAMGAMALFGEKYGDHVRIVTFDQEYSRELCGGTHVQATGEIGMIKIISETAVAAGVRRIEALSAKRAEEFFRRQSEWAAAVQGLLNHPKDPIKAVKSLIKDKRKLEKALEALHQEKINTEKQRLQASIQHVKGCQVILAQTQLPHADGLKKISFELKNEIENLLMVLAADIGGKPQIAVMIDEKLVESKRLDASKIIQTLAKAIKGGGGGQPFYATAGGKDMAGLPRVITAAHNMLDEISA